VSGLAPRAAALGLLAAAAAYLWLATRLRLGTVAAPGAGFFPVVVGAFLCATAASLVLRLWRPGPRSVGLGARSGGGLPGAQEAAGEPAATAEGARRRLGATVGALVGFCLSLPWIGYPVAAFAFVLVLLRALGMGRWTAAALWALGAAAVSYYFFAALLGVPLPRGWPV
jgi:hypothetical protein